MAKESIRRWGYDAACLKQQEKTLVNLLEERGKVCVQTLVKDGGKIHYPAHLVEQSDL